MFVLPYSKYFPNIFNFWSGKLYYQISNLIGTSGKRLNSEHNSYVGIVVSDFHQNTDYIYYHFLNFCTLFS